MSKAKPTVGKFMSTSVETINAGKTLKDAKDLMAKQKIHHLPVTANNEVIGIISDRDIKAALGIIGIDLSHTIIQDVCKDEVYMVDPEMPLDVVVETMARKHYGSVVVMQNNKLVGILTLIDVCKALCFIINERFHS